MDYLPPTPFLAQPLFLHILHGVAGRCIVLGAIRNREQEFSTQGAQAYLVQTVRHREHFLPAQRLEATETLGVASGGAVLLTLSFMMALITYGTGRASLLSGIVHLILLATWIFLMVVP